MTSLVTVLRLPLDIQSAWLDRPICPGSWQVFSKVPRYHLFLTYTPLQKLFPLRRCKFDRNLGLISTNRGHGDY